MLLILVAWPPLATNNDYVALKALYEATNGIGWKHNAKMPWDMSNTDVCGWNDPTWPVLVCTGGRVTSLCVSAYTAVDSAVLPLTLAPPSRSQEDRGEQPERHDPHRGRPPHPARGHVRAPTLSNVCRPPHGDAEQVTQNLQEKIIERFLVGV